MRKAARNILYRYRYGTVELTPLQSCIILLPLRDLDSMESCRANAIKGWIIATIGYSRGICITIYGDFCHLIAIVCPSTSRLEVELRI